MEQREGSPSTSLKSNASDSSHASAATSLAPTIPTPYRADSQESTDVPMPSSLASQEKEEEGTSVAKPKNATSKSVVTKEGEIKPALPIPKKAPAGRHHLLRGVQKYFFVRACHDAVRLTACRAHVGSPTDKLLSPATEKIEVLRRKHTLAT